MPFLRAASITERRPEVVRKRPKFAIRTFEDLKVAAVVKAWLYADDRSTEAERSLLGL
ncbi:MAG: hypothetical protein IJM68_01075 [Synergistaceae bacterium]|nr:hypothetical protein [Synergistaceae bacterium]